MTVVAKPDLKPNTIDELLDYIRANKDNVTYAHAGLGTASRICAACCSRTPSRSR